MVTDRRVALALFFTGTAERNALINQDVIPDLGRFSDHHAIAVIDEQAPPYPSPGMNFDARQKTCKLGDQPGDNRKPRSIQPVGDPVHQNSVQTGVAEQDFKDILSRRIFLEDGIDLLPQFPPHALIMMQASLSKMQVTHFEAVRVQWAK